jgi:thiamine-monophosphate kinase
MMNEFNIIEKYFAPLAKNNPGALGLSDDAAIITPHPFYQLIVTKDAITENVHFFSDDAPGDIARKLLRVNLSDLASMGATPLYYFLACIFPRNVTEQWIKQFAEGLAADNKAFQISLMGGDTTTQDGPLSLSLTAIGEIPEGMALRRAGAKAGDTLYVSGTIGDAALGLRVLKGELTALSSVHKAYLVSRYHTPQPRIMVGKGLRLSAHSVIDISDGLVQDAQHMAESSRVRIIINQADIPLSSAAKAALALDPSLHSVILSGGDDYELLFSASKNSKTSLKSLAASLDLPITAIGSVKRGKGVAVLAANNEPLELEISGYDHFR